RRSRAPRYDVACFYVAVGFVGQGHCAYYWGITDADRYDCGPLSQCVGVDVALQNRMKAGVGLNRHHVVRTEKTKEHGVVADVAAHIEVDPATRSYHRDVFELIYF